MRWLTAGPMSMRFSWTMRTGSNSREIERVDRRGTRRDHDPDVVGAVVLGLQADGDRHGGAVRRVISEVPHQVREGLAELRGIDAHAGRGEIAGDPHVERS